jgi:hypothetical protein
MCSRGKKNGKQKLGLSEKTKKKHGWVTRDPGIPYVRRQIKKQQQAVYEEPK